LMPWQNRGFTTNTKQKGSVFDKKDEVSRGWPRVQCPRESRDETIEHDGRAMWQFALDAIGTTIRCLAFREYRVIPLIFLNQQLQIDDTKAPRRFRSEPDPRTRGKRRNHRSDQHETISRSSAGGMRLDLPNTSVSLSETS
jgi:hypothetical protein